jgi:hypothetical protein
MRRLLSEGIAHLADCPTASALAVCVLGAGSGSVEYVVHTLIMRKGPSGLVYAFVDASIIGAVAALVGTLVIVGIRERRRRELEHIKTVAELNHQVRNALQIIAESRYLREPTQTEAVLASVDRIDRTLRSLFPTDNRSGGDLHGPRYAERTYAANRAEAA